MTSTPHDALFKAAFEHPEHATGLLRSILPPALVAAIDWTTLERQPGSFVDARLSDTHTDLLFRAKLPSYDPDHQFYILVEHRSTLDRQLPRRMLGYGMDCWEECHKEQRRKKFVGPLPVVLPVLISHALGGWTTPTTMQALFAPAPDAIPGLAPFVPHVSLLVEDLTLRSNEDLRALPLQPFPVLALWLLRDARVPERLLANLAHWLDALAATLRVPGGAGFFMQLMSYVAWVCSDEHFEQFRETICTRISEAEETMITYAEKLIAQGVEKGRAEGVEKGREEGRTELLEKQLTLKFGEVPPTYRARLGQATREQIDRYAARVLTADTLAAVFAD